MRQDLYLDPHTGVQLPFYTVQYGEIEDIVELAKGKETHKPRFNKSGADDKYGDWLKGNASEWVVIQHMNRLGHFGQCSGDFTLYKEVGYEDSADGECEKYPDFRWDTKSTSGAYFAVPLSDMERRFLCGLSPHVYIGAKCWFDDGAEKASVIVYGWMAIKDNAIHESLSHGVARTSLITGTHCHIGSHIPLKGTFEYDRTRCRYVAHGDKLYIKDEGDWEDREYEWLPGTTKTACGKEVRKLLFRFDKPNLIMPLFMMNPNFEELAGWVSCHFRQAVSL